MKIRYPEKIKAAVMLITLLACLVVIQVPPALEQIQPDGVNQLQSGPVIGNFWLGLSYYAGKKSPEMGLTLGALGVIHGALWGFAVGGPAGAAVGAAYGF